MKRRERERRVEECFVSPVIIDREVNEPPGDLDAWAKRI